MWRVVMVFGSLFSLWSPASVHAASVVDVSDHTLPGRSVATYHVKCSNGSFGIMRLESRKMPQKLCASVQDGSKPEQCIEVNDKTVADTLKSGAEHICR